jgi:hypothetical protein
MRSITCLVAPLLALSLALFASSPARAQGASIDVSGAALFWRAVDGVTTGAIMPDSARALLAAHPGYQVIERSGTRLRYIHHCFQRMAPRANRDSLIAAIPSGPRAFLYPYICDHLDSARAHRSELESFARALAEDATEQRRIAAALDTARAFLPDALRASSPPAIYAMLFEPGGFGGTSIAVDLLRHLRRPSDERVAFFAHELHHVLMARLPADIVPATDSAPHPTVIRWLGRTQWEGIASLMDKRRFVELTATGPQPSPTVSEGFPREHAMRLADSRRVLDLVDSAISRRHRGEISDADLTAALEASIPDGAHALGQYLAMAIEAELGRAGIVAAAASRFTFIKSYQRAAFARPAQFRAFSPDAVAYLTAVEATHALPLR